MDLSIAQSVRHEPPGLVLTLSNMSIASIFSLGKSRVETNDIWGQVDVDQ